MDLVVKIANSGINGYACITRPESRLKKTLLAMPPTNTLIHLKGDDVAIWRMSHVHFLLSDKGKKTELETRQAMNHCGWV